MTTATRRLRRASVAGLATIATAAAVVASAGSALAFVTATGAAHATLTADSTPSLSVGASSQTLGTLTLAFPANASAHEFSTGEQLTFVLDSDGNGPAGTTVNDGSNTLNTASFSGTPTVTADNGVTPVGTIALKSVNGTNDAFTFTFGSDAPENATATNFTIANLKVSLGSKVDPGQTILVDAGVTSGVNPNIFWNGAAAVNNTSVGVGIIPQVNLAASTVAVSAPLANGVALGVITIKDVSGGAITNGDALTLQISGGVFTTLPTATGTPAVSAITGLGTNTLHFAAAAGSAAGNVITLTGAKITAGAAGANTATLSDATNPFGIDPTAKVATAVTLSRLGGADRYGTGSLVYAAGLYTAKSVVLTSGANFPDALSAQFLAKALSTNLAATVGVLTTDPASLSTQTRTALVGAQAIDTVYILGGTAAVSANVAAQVAALHVGNVQTAANLNVIRIAGADRFATNNAADLYLGAVSGSGHAFIATGNNFADALAIGPAVYATGDPLVLTDGTTLSASAKSTLQSLGISNVTIVGGTAAVATTVETAVTALGITDNGRLAGADRTLTAAAVEGYEVALGVPFTFNITTVYIARGDNFADALVAGPLAGKNHHPILLTGDPNTLGAGIPSVLGGSTTTTTLTALGLTGAVSVATLNAAAASLG